MRPPLSANTRPRDLGMTSMVDVVFLLLVFFVWTTNFDPPETDVAALTSTREAADATSVRPSREARVATTPPVPVDEIVVRVIHVDGLTAWRWNRSPVPSLADLSERFASVAELGLQPPVIVDPADAILTEDAIATYDAARMAGLSRVFFAIDELEP
ncbi:MAG: biopolymer transporter ExbD [Planctomycetota bacterium]